MYAPLLSSISLCTELVVSSAIFYLFYSGYYRNHFPYHLAVATLSYDVIFNISYMASRMFGLLPDVIGAKHSSLEILLAIFHGTLSLVMFITLLVFMGFAYRGYKRGVNFFAYHPYLTITFLCFWSLSVLSGITFFLLLYVLPASWS